MATRWQVSIFSIASVHAGVLCGSRNGGESGIRTHVTLSSKHAFQACAFSHSAISPFFYVPNAFELLYTRLRGISGTHHAGSAYRGGRDRYGRLVFVGARQNSRGNRDSGFRASQSAGNFG